jgi:hypothetical protein
MDDVAVKVLFIGPDGEVETLWANRVAPGRFALDNLPWFAYGVSAGDVVEAEPNESGMLVFKRVIEKSGNRTIRVTPEVAQAGGEWTFESRRLMDTLVDQGCDFEGANKSFVAVNIPPEVRLEAVVELLIESGFNWEYAYPTYADLYPSQSIENESPDV